MGNRFTFLYHTNTFSATIACLLTLWAMLLQAVTCINLHKSLENYNGEKEIKAGNRSNPWQRPRDHEKKGLKDFV